MDLQEVLARLNEIDKAYLTGEGSPRQMLVDLILDVEEAVAEED
jgi:hypothetical protein